MGIFVNALYQTLTLTVNIDKTYVFYYSTAGGNMLKEHKKIAAEQLKFSAKVFGTLGFLFFAQMIFEFFKNSGSYSHFKNCPDCLGSPVLNFGAATLFVLVITGLILVAYLHFKEEE